MYPLFLILQHLASLKAYVSFVFKIPVNRQKGEQLEAPLYREKRDIESLQDMARSTQQQSTLTGFFRVGSDIS